MVSRIALMLVYLISFCVAATAEQPSNVLVGDLTFIRPEKWTWEAPISSSSAVTKFLVPDASGNSSETSVRFYHGPKDGSAAFAAWSKWFPGESQEGWPEKKTINNRTISYYRLNGIYAVGNLRKNNHTLIGAVIPSAGKFVHVLLVGPTSNVKVVMTEYKQMVEAALKEAE